MAITHRKPTAVLIGAIMLAAAPLLMEARAGAAKLPAAGVPVGPGADLTLLSKGTTNDPFEIQAVGPTQFEWAQVTVAPHGTTGLSGGGGVVVATVTHGVATAVSSEAGGCASRSVETGASFIRPAGQAGAIRNDTSDAALELTVVTLTPSGRVDAPPAGACAAAAPDGVTWKVLQRSIVEKPFSTEFKGSSDIWVGLVNFAAGGTLPWHVQQRPYFLGVNEGDVTLTLANEGACAVTTYPAGQGFFEPPRTDHLVSNNAKQSAAVYFIGFAPSPQPLIAPAAPARGC